MSDVAVPLGPGVYEPSLFGTYSKKIGMWLFLLSDSLTFGALLYAYTYGRVSTPNWPTPFHSESIRNATLMTGFLLTSSLTMVFAVREAALGNAKAQRLLAARHHGLRTGIRRTSRPRVDQAHRRRPDFAHVPRPSWGNR